EAPSPKAAALLKAMVNTHKGATYEEVDCTEFIRDALIKAGFKVTREIVNTIMIRDYARATLEETQKAVLGAIEVGDDGPGGAATAIVQSGQGEVVRDPVKLAPGDIVQYWRV